MDEPLSTLPAELLGVILSFVRANDAGSLASTSKKWSNLTWSKIAHFSIPGHFKNPLLILQKCDPKSLTSLYINLHDANKLAQNTLGFIQTLSTFKNLTELQLYASSSERSALYDALYQLTRLKMLDLVDSEFDDQLFARLPTLTKLTELGITNVEHSNFASLPVEEFTFLANLKFPFSDLDDRCLDRILTLTQLEFLDLTWCAKITYNSFSNITKMKNLTKLDLSRCAGIMAPSFELLAELPRLWTLDLSYHNGMGTKEIETISQIPHITCLYLAANTSLSIESYDYIARMNNLRELHLLEGQENFSLAVLTSLTNLHTLHTDCKKGRHSIAIMTHLKVLNLFNPENGDLEWMCTMTWLKRLLLDIDFDQERLTEALLHTMVLLPEWAQEDT